MGGDYPSSPLPHWAPAPKPQGGELITGSELAVVAHRRLTDAQEIEACSLYADQHRTLREIAQLYGLTPAGVLKILIRNNIVRRSKGWRHPMARESRRL